MSKIGVSTARKTKYKPASNNPFQGPMAVSFNYNRPPFPPAFLTYDGFDPERAIRNSMFAFNIERVGGVNRYGDNSDLRMRVAEAQRLDEETGINLNFGVNNNTVLAGTDGIATIEVEAFMGNGKENLPIACLGTPISPESGLRPTCVGVFTKDTAATVGVTLRDGDNFKFSLQQALEATGASPEEANGTLYITPEIQAQLREPGSQVLLTFVVTILFNNQAQENPVSLEARLQMLLRNTE
ncbi:MAG: hypothetical protein ACTSPB_01835 [Candidatus Thorarchaeota archaeon]